MTLNVFTSIDKAIDAAYSAAATLGEHQQICKLKSDNKKFAVFSKGSIPPGYTKLPLGEIIALVQKLIVDDNFKGNMKLADALGYMGNRTIKKTFSCCIGSLRWFFVCLANLFQGKGFLTVGEQALELEEEITGNAAKKNPYDYRSRIFQETLKACKYGYRTGEKVVTINHNPMLQNTVTYGAAPLTPLIPVDPVKRHKTAFTVTNDDTFNVLLKYVRAGKNPVGINMANQFHPGGGVVAGCPAQEEALCRRSNHYDALLTQTYPLPECGGVYSPHVSVFREDEESHYAFKETPEIVNLVAVAAYDLRGHQDLSYDALKQDAQFVNGTKTKIQNLLRIMAMKGHDTLVLGALGCGAFQNPPKLVAELFMEVFQEPEFQGRFKTVDFAILCQYPKDQENVDAFTTMCEELNK